MRGYTVTTESEDAPSRMLEFEDLGGQKKKALQFKHYTPVPV
jgi:hypothetical protein